MSEFPEHHLRKLNLLERTKFLQRNSALASRKLRVHFDRLRHKHYLPAILPASMIPESSGVIEWSRAHVLSDREIEQLKQEFAGRIWQLP